MNEKTTFVTLENAIRKYLKDFTNATEINDVATRELYDLCDLAEKLGFERGWKRCEDELHKQ